MNNKLYGKLIFELSHEGSKAYSLPENEFGDYELPSEMRREADAELPECDELTVVRHYTNMSGNNFGVDNGFYPLGSCTMKYNPYINEEMAAAKAFSAVHPLQPVAKVRWPFTTTCNVRCVQSRDWESSPSTRLPVRMASLRG